MPYPLKLENMMTNSDAGYKYIKDLCSNLILSSNNELRRNSEEQLFEIFGFSLKSCFIHERNLMIGLETSKFKSAVYVCKVPDIFIVDHEYPYIFNYKGYIDRINNLMKSPFQKTY